MHLSYAKPVHASVRGVARLSLLLLTGVLALYVLLYAAAFSRRGPAANMAYWVYPEIPICGEEALCRFFYPMYCVHRLLGGPRHNNDRPPIVFPPEFEG